MDGMSGITSISHIDKTGNAHTVSHSSVGKEETLIPQDSLVKNLQAENRKLEQELEKLKRQVAENETKHAETEPTGSKIEYDLDSNLLKMRNIKTKDMFIEQIDVHIRQGDDVFREMFSVDNFIQSDGKLDTSAINKLRQIPMDVENVRIRIPEETATRALLNSKKSELKAEGIKEIGIRFKKGNKISIKGTAKKILSIPFKISGKLSLTDDNKVSFKMGKMHVAGLLPVPKIIKGIIMALTDDSMTDEKIQREGNSYILDASAFLPKNIKVSIKDIKTEEGFLILEGGSPDKNKKNNNPKTLVME